MGMLSEFKQFAMKGNVIDLAVGVIIGAAFGKIVSSLIDDIIMPVVGKVIGNVDFSNVYVALSDKITPGLTLVEAKKLGPVLAWGNFASILLNFAILAFIIFLMVKGINNLKRKEEAKPAAAPAPSNEAVLLKEIRDLLKSKG